MGIYNSSLTLEWAPQVWDRPYASGLLYILLMKNIASLLNKKASHETGSYKIFSYLTGSKVREN